MNAVLAQDGKCYVGQRPVPSLREKEVLVKIAYTAINRADTLQRTSKYPPPPGCTDILGLEATGTVAALGPGTSGRWALGSRVMALLPGGGNAEWVAVHEDHLLAVPEGMPWATAAAIPETWLTAYQLLFMVGQLRAGETVLIHAAGSGVGTAATQLAASAGATVIAVAGADSKLEVAKSLGASATVNYKTTPAFSAAVLEATGGRGADLVLDPVAASFWKENAAAIAQDGRWVLYGSMGGLNTEGNLLGMVRERPRLIVVVPVTGRLCSRPSVVAATACPLTVLPFLPPSSPVAPRCRSCASASPCSAPRCGRGPTVTKPSWWRDSLQTRCPGSPPVRSDPWWTRSTPPWATCRRPTSTWRATRPPARWWCAWTRQKLDHVIHRN